MYTSKGMSINYVRCTVGGEEGVESNLPDLSLGRGGEEVSSNITKIFSCMKNGAKFHEKVMFFIFSNKT